MGLLDRLMGKRRSVDSLGSVGSFAPPATPSLVLGGNEDLEVVGELAYQADLWRLSGGTLGDSVRHPIVAVLVPEPTNPQDPSAIAVRIGGYVVGYLSRANAQQYLPGLENLMSRARDYVGLQGVIVGGGYYDDGPGRLGVWLEHDPADFGLRGSSRPRAPGHAQVDGVMRTGFTEAWLTDIEDDSYDLSWYDALPEADRPAIEELRKLLAEDPDPIDRHFQFAELETRLYRSRDLFETALDGYDVVCAQHDTEMETVCAAFMSKWGKVPLLDTYRQMAIRQQKKKDWQACLWWAERGLSLYGHGAAREDAVEDLLKRRNRALSKLEPVPRQRVDHRRVTVTENAEDAARVLAGVPGEVTLEVLTCGACGCRFERMIVRGRKPAMCTSCRAVSQP